MAAFRHFLLKPGRQKSDRFWIFSCQKKTNLKIKHLRTQRIMSPNFFLHRIRLVLENNRLDFGSPFFSKSSPLTKIRYLAIIPWTTCARNQTSRDSANNLIYGFFYRVLQIVKPNRLDFGSPFITKSSPLGTEPKTIHILYKYQILNMILSKKSYHWLLILLLLHDFQK